MQSSALIPPANAISCDNEGRLFVGDGTNLKLLLLDGGTGELLRVFRHDGEIMSVWVN